MDKILYVIYTHNRPTILKQCIETLFNAANTLWPTEVIILDDNSDPNLKDSLYMFSRSNKDFPIHFWSFGAPQGLGYNWELVWNYIKSRDFDYVCQIEQDYIFRQDGIKEAIDLLKAKPLSCCVSGYSNPDFYNGKQETLFREVMVDLYKEDNAKREYLHKPFEVETDSGKLEIQLTTNSCGTFICNWNRIKALLSKYPNMWEKVFERAFNKGFDRRYAGDGPITSGISNYWYKDIEDRIHREESIDYKIEAPWLDICDYSISDHKNGGYGSLNGYIVPEGSSFVSSPKWSDDYLINNPRKTK